jgi:hypothetical protein
MALRFIFIFIVILGNIVRSVEYESVCMPEQLISSALPVLPPGAQQVKLNESEGWKIEGAMDGGYGQCQQAFGNWLSVYGWELLHATTFCSEPGQRAVLQTWEKTGTRILLLLSESGYVQCWFRVGILPCATNGISVDLEGGATTTTERKEDLPVIGALIEVEKIK